MKKLLAIIVMLFVVPLAHSSPVGHVIIPIPKFEDEVILNSTDQGVEKIVRNAILSGADQNNWELVQDKGNTLRLRLIVRRKHNIVVDVRIAGNTVAVDYVSSSHMRYRKNFTPTGVNSDNCTVMNMCATINKDVIHRNYGIWVKKLLKSSREAAKGLQSEE